MIIKNKTNGLPTGGLIMLTTIDEYDENIHCKYTPNEEPQALSDMTKCWVSVDKNIGDNSWIQDFESVDIEFETEELRQAAIAQSNIDEFNRIREMRDYELGRTDWYGLQDTPDMPEAVRLYRQQLRDITTAESDPFNIVFPDNPLNLP